MTDDDVERRLRGYRPLGPPPALRARVTALETRRRHPLAAWLAVAATLAAIGLHALASRTIDHVVSDADRPYAAARDRALDELTSAFGGDSSARAAAARYLEENSWLR
jgi:hypothetical protein